MSRKKEVEYEVEQIRAIRTDKSTGAVDGLVKWLDFDETHTAWEPMAHLVHAPLLVKQAQEHLYSPDATPEWTWEYYLDAPIDGKSVGWHPYDASAAVCMNRYFRSYCLDRSQMTGVVECVPSGKYPYDIDFDKMEQTNVRVAARTVRPIRGIPVLV